MTTLPTEHQEQCAFVNWFRAQFRGVRIFAIPNGGKRNVIVATRLRDEGASAGVPDLFCPAWHLWVELKRRKGGRLTKHQEDWIAYLESIGHTVLIGKGATDAREKVVAWRKEQVSK